MSHGKSTDQPRNSWFVNQHFLRPGLELDLTVRARVVGILLITWAPLLLLALLEGRVLGTLPTESLLLDFGSFA